MYPDYCDTRKSGVRALKSARQALRGGQSFQLENEDRLGAGDRNLTVDLERWAEVRYTEYGGGAFPPSHWMSKDLVFAQRLESKVWGHSTGHS